MSYQLTVNFTGEIGVTPRLVRLESNDAIADIITAGYLTPYSVLPTDIIFCSYEGNGTAMLSAAVSSVGIVTLSLSGAGAVDSVFSRTGIVTAQSGDYTAAQVTNAADKSSLSPQTFLSALSAVTYSSTGLTGATQTSRYVGATASGAPASGTFAIGDFAIARDGAIWVCTAAGTPGTWVAAGDNTVSSVFGRTGAVVAVDGDYSQSLVTGLKTSDSPTFTNVNAGASGTAGYLASYSSTLARGYLKVQGVANTGDTITTLSNAAMGQATVVSIPDPGAATANILLDAGATTMAAGSKINFAKNVGTEAANAVTVDEQAGVITTSSLTTAAGASYTITFTNNKIVAGSVILLSFMGGTNTVKAVTMSATAGSGTSSLVINNIHAASSLDGTLIIGFAVV